MSDIVGSHFKTVCSLPVVLSSSIDEKIIKWAIKSENKVGVFISFKLRLFIYGECFIKDTTFKTSFDCNETTPQTVKQS